MTRFRCGGQLGLYKSLDFWKSLKLYKSLVVPIAEGERLQAFGGAFWPLLAIHTYFRVLVLYVTI